MCCLKVFLHFLQVIERFGEAYLNGSETYTNLDSKTLISMPGAVKPFHSNRIV